MALSTQPYKGTRDFYPEDKRVQKYMFGNLRRVVEGYGYQEYDAPIIEPIELYMSKTSEEIVVEQTFVFTDRGGRTVTLRPEMTPSVSRMVAGKRQELSYPLRLYSIPNLFRYERPQAGRLREHWQLNVDIFGVAGLEADHEIIQIADSILKAFGAKTGSYSIRINSRQLVNWLLIELLQLERFQVRQLVRLIDSKHKMPAAEFKDAIETIMGPEHTANGMPDRLLEILHINSLDKLPLDVQQHPSVKQLQKLIQMLGTSGVTTAEYDPTLMRGFEYYTDIVFEVFDNHPENNRSMFGGGRYDGLVGGFGVDPLPTVGFGMGDVTLQRFLEGHNLLPKLAAETDAAVILVGDVYDKAQKFLADMRKEGLRLAVDSSGRKLDSQLKSAVKAKIPYVIFVGDKEMAANRYKLKELATGEEIELSPERLVSKLARRHRSKDDLA